MRVLQIISTIGYYGAESVVSGLAGDLHSRGVGVAVCILTSRTQRSCVVADKALQLGIPALEICCSGKFDWQAIRALRRFIREQKITIIHAHNYKSNFYALLAACGLNMRFISTCHNWTNATRSLRFYAALDRMVLHRFSRTIAVSGPIARSLLAAGVPPERIFRIDNGIDLQQFENISVALSSEITAGTASRLVPEKGLADLLQAAKEILAQYQNVRFLIAGEGPARAQLEKLATELGIDSHVTFSGFCTDMPRFYAAIDVFVLPSHNEGMPMSVLEAMAASKPVIVTRVGELPRMITEETGFLIVPGDRDALCKALAILIEDRELRTKMGHAAAQRAQESFSLRSMADSYFNIYQEISALPKESVGPLATAESAETRRRQKEW